VTTPAGPNGADKAGADTLRPPPCLSPSCEGLEALAVMYGNIDRRLRSVEGTNKVILASVKQLCVALGVQVTEVQIPISEPPGAQKGSDA
jgi:hypothetical protein